MPVDIETLRTELRAVNDGATALCEGLAEGQLAWRPHPTKWSIAENLIHLCKTTVVFLPAVDDAIIESRHRKSMDARSSYDLGWYGRLLVWYVEPPPIIRLPAPSALLPILSASSVEVLENFLVSQSTMMNRMEGVSGLNLTGHRFPSPLASYVRMNLLEFFSVFNGQSRRHLWQAANVRNAIYAAR